MPSSKGALTEEDGSIWLERSCPEHGHFRDLYWSDAALWHKFEQYDSVGRGVENPNVIAKPRDLPGKLRALQLPTNPAPCLPTSISRTGVTSIVISVLPMPGHADSSTSLSFDQIVGMMKMLRSQKPVPAPAVQFSGGEPTMRDDLMELIRKAKEIGFPQVQLATNGIKMAQDIGLCGRTQGCRALHGLPPF